MDTEGIANLPLTGVASTIALIVLAQVGALALATGFAFIPPVCWSWARLQLDR